MKNPLTAPNIVGESKHKKIGPGIANAWSNMYK
jgi:hypothetical protein